MRLAVNIDHVATLREARKAREPEPLAAAVLAELAGAEGITVHLRSDRRHIKERDLELLREVVATKLNVEMAATEEMAAIAARVKPEQVTLVPERPNELTTEGGLDVVSHGHLQIETSDVRLDDDYIHEKPAVIPKGHYAADAEHACVRHDGVHGPEGRDANRHGPQEHPGLLEDIWTARMNLSATAE